MPRVNKQIRADKVLLIDPDGAQVGVKDLDEALWLAEELGLDLVEMNRDARPPVVRIMDYGKFRYDQSKKAREARKNRKPDTKTIQLSPTIAEGDYQTKLRHAREFLDDKHPVLVSMRFRGREISHIEIGQGILERFMADISEHGVVEDAPRKEGRRLLARLAPL